MQDFTTIVVIAEEGPKQLEFFLRNFRKCYPKIPIHIISDGVADPNYPKICKIYKADYTLGRYLKRIEAGGLWWKRTLEIGLKYGKKWIIKVDPDTKFWRPFRAPPQHPVSGTHNNIGNPNEYIQGGCQAIRRDVAERILSSGILASDNLRKLWNFCPDRKFLNSWYPTGYFTTDFSLVYILRKLGIEFGDWADIGCQWRVAPPNFDLAFAVTHPHKVADNKKVGMADSVPITIITTCKDRKQHLEQTLPRWLKEKNINVVVVDFNCPQNVGNWVEKNYPNVRVARVANEAKFHLAKARNVGAKYAPDGWWCFMDADMLIEKGWADQIRKVLADGYYYIASPLRWGMTGTCIVHSKDFRKAGGYDEVIGGWGCEDLDFYTRLRQINVRPAFWNGNYGHNIQHSDDERTKHYDVKAKEVAVVQNGKYVRAKSRLMVNNWRFLTLEERRDLWATITGTTIRKDQKVPHKPHKHKCKVDIVFQCGHCGHKGHCRAVCKCEDCPDNNYPCGKPITKPTDKSGIPERSFFGPSPGGTGRGGPISGSNHSGGQGSYRAGYHNGGGQGSYGYVGGGRSSNGGNSNGGGINISVVNHSTINLGMSLDDLCRAGADYLDLLAQHWPGVQARLIPTDVILPHTHALVIMDDPDHNRQQLGYSDHTPDGLPLAKVFAKQEMVKGVPITVTFTHELGEFRVDPNNSKSATNNDGTVYALEIADPVEDDSFNLHGVLVANFVLPAWFEAFHHTNSIKFDYMGLLNRPFSLSQGGFATVRGSNGQWMELHGSHPKLEDLNSRDQREWRNTGRKDQHHASTRLAHGAYLQGSRR